MPDQTTPESTSARLHESTPLLDAASRRSAGTEDAPQQRYVVEELFRSIRRKFKPPRLDGDGEPMERLPPSVVREVRVLYVLASLTGGMLTTCTPMLLYYLQYIGYATTTDVSYFVLISSIQTAVPVAGHASLGMMCSRYGARRTVCLTALLAACALCILAYSRESRWVFAAAFIFHSFSRSIRVARTVRIAEIVPAHARTHVMSIHMFCSPLGSAIGPMIWLLCSQFSGDFHLFSSLYLNKFTLDYFAAAGLAASIALISYIGLSDSSPRKYQEVSAQHVSIFSLSDVFGLACKRSGGNRVPADINQLL